MSAILENGQKAVTTPMTAIETWEMDYKLNGFITINDNLEVSSGKDDSNSTNSNSVIRKTCCYSSKLSDDFHCLLNNSDSFADATLKCGDAEFPVHRGILGARSPVFAAMFKTQMQEGRDGVVDIVDMEPDVLHYMLCYVYSEKTDHWTVALAGDLLFAADKYQLEELKLFCVEKLKSSMTANNVFRALVIGDLVDGSLKSLAMDFIHKFQTFSELEKTED